MARRRPRPATRRQPLGPSSVRPRTPAAGHGGARTAPHPSGRAGAGGHRDRDPLGPGPRGRRHRRAPRARRDDLRRRLRDRQRLPQLPQAHGDRRAEDRQVVRQRHGARPPRLRHRQVDHRPGARPRSAHRRRGHRGRGDGSGAPRAGLRDRAGLPPRSAHHAGTAHHPPADAGSLDDPVAGAVFLTVLVVAACLLAMASPVIAGRWPAALLLHRWRWSPLIWATLLLQVVVVEVTLPGALAPVLHVATYAVAVVFLVVNRRLTGALVVAAGAATNGIAIAFNGGVLPASAAAGIDPDTGFANSAVVDNPVLPWLGDVFAWPEPLPLANVFSVGDVLITVGVLLAAWTGTRRLARGALRAEATGQPPRAGPGREQHANGDEHV